MDGFEWLRLRKVEYKDAKGQARFWESCDRTTRRGDVDGVSIFATLSSKSGPRRVVVVLQYRPPVGNYVLELPAGLIDEGETPETAALRELHEETGYVGQIKCITPITVVDPGMSSAASQLVICDVDMDVPSNQFPSPAPDDTELITVMTPEYKKLLSQLLQIQKEKGCMIDARLFHLALGLDNNFPTESGESVHLFAGMTAIGITAAIFIAWLAVKTKGRWT